MLARGLGICTACELESPNHVLGSASSFLIGYNTLQERLDQCIRYGMANIVGACSKHEVELAAALMRTEMERK